MLNKLKNLFSKPPKVEPVVETVVEPKPKKPRKPKEKKVEVQLTAKEKATMAGEPYVNILSMDIDPNDINSGAFELDWNDKFILNLVRAGYKMSEDDTDNDIIDRWFQAVCRNVVLEIYEQQQADPDVREMTRTIVQRDIGNGKTEVS
jgi:hypothetical protein